MNQQTRDYCTQLLYTAIISDPHSGLGSVILSTAAQLCTDDAICAQFVQDVRDRRENMQNQ